MEKLRKYGSAPFSVVVIHGGPGAPGEMAPVARELSLDCGVLEPLQGAVTLEGQVLELKEVLECNGDSPFVLLGHSWGAMLGFIFTARFPELVRKLILIGSGPYKAKYAGEIMKSRLDRLSAGERFELEALVKVLESPSGEKTDDMMIRLGELVSKTDSYNPVIHENEVLECNAGIFQGVWNEAADLRRRGGFPELGKRILCPVVAIHGDYDPHPAEGIDVPLSEVLEDFRFVLLEKCGHTPWIEAEARDVFYNVIRRELE